MITSEMLARINELAKKSKEKGLTDDEKKEQQRLRNDYLEGFRNSFTNQIKTMKIVDEEGNDVTPEKIKQLKNNSQDKRK